MHGSTLMRNSTKRIPLFLPVTRANRLAYYKFSTALRGAFQSCIGSGHFQPVVTLSTGAYAFYFSSSKLWYRSCGSNFTHTEKKVNFIV